MTELAVRATIVATRGIAPVYERDDDGLRLARVVREPPGVADLAECSRVVDDRGDPVRALVLRSVPIAPGSRVMVRPLGLLHPRPGEPPVLVGSALADPYAPELNGSATLRADLERLALPDAGASYAQISPRWEDRDAAARFVQAGVSRASVLRSGRRSAAVWSRPELADRSGVEARVHRLPARFQDFVRQLLVADERIHFFAARPERLRRWIFGRSTGEALLLITDRQVLWIDDARPRDTDLVSWGYEAKSMPLERLREIRRDPGSLTLAGEAGGEPLVLDIGAQSGALVADIEVFLDGFVRRDRSLPMRRYTVSSRADPLIVPDGWPDARPLGEGLCGLLRRELGVDPLVAAYLKPMHRDRDREGVLALYPSELVFVSSMEPEPARWVRVRLIDLAWVELRRSVLSSHLRVVGMTNDRWPVASAAPLLPLYGALRQLIANPV